MSDELQAAAEMFLQAAKSYEDKTANMDDGIIMMEMGHQLATAYLSEHPADEDQLADGGWLRSVGAIRPMASAGSEEYVIGEWRDSYHPMLFVRQKGERSGGATKLGPLLMYVFGGRVKENPTRGDVRKLARVFGIDLKETT